MNENFEKIKGRLGEAEVLAQLAEECAELAQAALKLRRALDGKNPTPNTEEERRRALIEEYTDVIHCALVLDLEMDLYQIRKKTERWMRRLGIRNGDEGIKGPPGARDVWPPFMLVGCAPDEVGPIGKPGPTEREMSDSDAQKVTNEVLKSLE